MNAVYTVEDFIKAIKIGDTFWYLYDDPTALSPVKGPLTIKQFIDLDDGTRMVKFASSSVLWGNHTYIRPISELASITAGVFFTEKSARQALERRRQIRTDIAWESTCAELERVLAINTPKKKE